MTDTFVVVFGIMISFMCIHAFSRLDVDVIKSVIGLAVLCGLASLFFLRVPESGSSKAPAKRKSYIAKGKEHIPRSTKTTVSTTLPLLLKTTLTQINGTSGHAKKIISIVGSIGAGKSTIVERLQKQTGWPLIGEKVDEWLCDPIGQMDWLKKYYDNIELYSCCFQLNVLKTQIEAHNEIQQHAREKNAPYIFSERSSLDSLFVFMEHFVRTGVCSESELNTLMWLYIRMGCWVPSILVFVDVSPEKCLERIHKRRRDCESSIDLEYLKSLDSCYRDMIKVWSMSGGKVICVQNPDDESLLSDANIRTLVSDIKKIIV